MSSGGSPSRCCAGPSGDLVRGLERRRGGGERRRRIPAGVVAVDRAVRHHRPGGVLRLPGTPPPGGHRWRRHPQPHLADDPVLHARYGVRRRRSGGGAWRGAQLPVAHLRPLPHPGAHRGRRRGRRPARRLRRPGRPHPTGPGHRRGHRPDAGRPAQAAPLDVRGADRHPGRPSGGMPGGRPAGHQPLGGGAPLPGVEPQPEGVTGAGVEDRRDPGLRPRHHQPSLHHRRVRATGRRSHGVVR